jgi:CheY-like chemotaxis protein
MILQKVASMKKEILVVDDVELNAILYRTLLEKEGFKVYFASSAIDAIALMTVKKVTPSLLITDIMMPEMDGFEFIKKLKEGGLLNMPFIFISAKSDTKDVEIGLAAGAAGYLTKPINNQLFVNKINSICRSIAS